MFVNFFKLLISFLIVAGLMAIYNVELSISMIQIIPILVMFFIFTFSICIILAHFGVFVEDLVNVVNILLKIIFYVSGIFYSISVRVPAPYGKIMAEINPIAFVIEQSRGALLYGQNINWGIFAIWFVVAILLCIVAIKITYKNENNYVKVMS